jgi:hypothetical protein
MGGLVLDSGLDADRDGVKQFASISKGLVIPLNPVLAIANCQTVSSHLRLDIFIERAQ